MQKGVDGPADRRRAGDDRTRPPRSCRQRRPTRRGQCAQPTDQQRGTTTVAGFQGGDGTCSGQCVDGGDGVDGRTERTGDGRFEPRLDGQQVRYRSEQSVGGVLQQPGPAVVALQADGQRLDARGQGGDLLFGFTLGGAQGFDPLVGRGRCCRAPLVVLVEPLLGRLHLGDRRGYRIHPGLGLLRPLDRGLDRRRQTRGFGVDGIGARPQVRDLALEPCQSLTAVGDGGDGGRMGALNRGGVFLGGGQASLDLFQCSTGLLDCRGELGFQFGRADRLFLELVGVGTARDRRRRRQVLAALGGDADRRIDALGQGRQPEPSLAGGMGGRLDLGQRLLAPRQFGRRGVQGRSDLGLLGADGVLERRLLGHVGAAYDEVVGRQTQSGVTQVRLDGGGAAGYLGLASEGLELAPQFTGEVGQPGEVSLHGVEFADGLLFALSMLEDAGGLLDKGTTVLRAGLEDRGKAALPDDDVHLAPDTGVTQQFLHVHQAAGLAVDLVLAGSVAEHAPRDGHLGVVDGQRTVGVVDRQRDLGATQRRPARRPREDDVFHLSAAQGLGTLLPHHPREGVHDVALPRPVGTHHTGDPGFKAQRRGRRKRLEPLQGQRFQMHDGTDYPFTARRTRSVHRVPIRIARPRCRRARACLVRAGRPAVGRGRCGVLRRRRGRARRQGSPRTRRGPVAVPASASTSETRRPARGRGRRR